MNRLRRSEDAARGAKLKDLAQVERQIRNIVEAVKEGMYLATMKYELMALEERKAALTQETAALEEEMPRLHPGLADIYRAKVADLTQALNDEALKDEAAGAVRSLISGIRMIPQDGKLMIELIGELAAILALGKGERPRPFGQGRQSTLVAGARNHLNLLFMAPSLGGTEFRR